MLMLSCIQPFVIPWTVVCQGFPQQKHWSGLPFPPPRDLPHPGIEPTSPALQADSLPLSHQGSPFSVHKGSQLSASYSGDLGGHPEDREPTCPFLWQAMNGFVK